MSQPETQDIRDDIAATREDLGRTVAALAAKTDLKSRLAAAARHLSSAGIQAVGGWAKWLGNHLIRPIRRP